MKWLRTCPAIRTPGRFTTVRGWKDPFLIMSEDEPDPDRPVISSIIIQDEVRSEFSGALLTSADGRPIIEGVAGFGDSGVPASFRQEGDRIGDGEAPGDAGIVLVVADGGDCAANQSLELDVRLGGDFSGDDDQSGGGQGFASHAAGRIFRQAGVEDGVRNLVGNFIGMALSHRLGRKQISVAG